MLNGWRLKPSWTHCRLTVSTALLPAPPTSRSCWTQPMPLQPPRRFATSSRPFGTQAPSIKHDGSDRDSSVPPNVLASNRRFPSCTLAVSCPAELECFSRCSNPAARPDACGQMFPPLARNRGGLEGPADLLGREEHLWRERPSVDTNEVVHCWLISVDCPEQLLHLRWRWLERGQLRSELVRRQNLAVTLPLP